MGSIAPEDEEVTVVEVREASPAHYLLKIESFSLLSESGIEKFESKEFKAGGYKWKMIIYPNGNTRENGSGHLSVYLAISGTSSLPAGWEVNAIFTFFLFNQLHDNYLSARGKMRRFQPIKSLWGLPKFLSHKAFKEVSNGYLVDDKCVVGAEIFIVQRQAIGECLSIVKSNGSFKREWKICNFSNPGKNWLSEEFTVGDHKWQLKLYPKGEAHNKGYIAIYLHSVDSKDFNHHQKVKANCSINLKNQINGGYKKRSYCKWFSATSRTWGFTGYMPSAQLHDQEKGYLVNDCIVVEIELEVVFKHSVKSLS
ncbi:MATH domain and coiled-coil domain-containing protein At3g58400-like [Solanum dulcamara]|uniref:MATH domain and coiled-coil domain-containing protein At3g58400-like n=1 Tax=Solanum dulcamara TaxID=45834 RepID=UPI002484FEFB|nr:MATH domain and coiled-coil domain-containing protein At3g58400-like [Solanum dulcamara]